MEKFLTIRGLNDLPQVSENWHAKKENGEDSETRTIFSILCKI
jgi:hypothetical protein